VQPLFIEPSQFEVRELPEQEKKVIKLEKFQSKADEEKCKNIIKDRRNSKENSVSEDAVPARLETGVSIYLKNTLKLGKLAD